MDVWRLNDRAEGDNVVAGDDDEEDDEDEDGDDSEDDVTDGVEKALVRDESDVMRSLTREANKQ